MILHFGATRATRDLDLMVLRGDVAELRKAALTVAGQRSLPEDWLNDAVKGFSDLLPPDFYHRLVALPFVFQKLHLYALGRPEQAAMKIVALREQDLEDLELLLPAMSDADRDTLWSIVNHVGKIRPELAQKMKFFLEEQGWPTR